MKIWNKTLQNQLYNQNNIDNSLKIKINTLIFFKEELEKGIKKRNKHIYYLCWMK